MMMMVAVVIIVIVVMMMSMISRQAQAWFMEAVDLAHEDVMRSLKALWSSYIDDAKNYSVRPASGNATTMMMMMMMMMIMMRMRMNKK